MDLIAASATLVTRRVSPDESAVLLVHRNPSLPVQGGVWAFPGGRVAALDGPSPPGLDTARNCAVREAAEETGLRLDAAALRLLARWVSPEQIRPRFDSWIFMGTVNDGNVQVDGREIVGHRWTTAGAALKAHQRGELQLSPPVFVMLSIFSESGEAAANWPLEQVLTFSPRLVETENGRCAVYQGDAAYLDGKLDRAGGRHRLWMEPDAWRYERRLAQ